MRIVKFLASVRSLTVAVLMAAQGTAMPEHAARRVTQMRRFIAVIALTACGQSFEVASVKLGKPPARSSFGPLAGGERYRAVNAPLNWLISEAYGVPMRQISGLPQAFSGDGYDIEAKADHPVNRDRMMAMVRTLLEDRFKLVVRRQTKEIKAYVLVVGKGGAKMEERRFTPTCRCRCWRICWHFPWRTQSWIRRGSLGCTTSR
jgi:hypothetical protein